MSYSLTYEQLRSDLYQAYLLARKHKSGKLYVQEFDRELDRNLDELAMSLWTRTYVILPNDCFATDNREIYAAQFRDRIVQHLYYMYTNVLFERTFIADTYSCIKGRGIHYGVERLRKHIKEESHNYTRKCYALYLDIKGYFMHINRQLLCDTVLSSLEKMRFHRIRKRVDILWDDMLDFDFIEYLTRLFTLFDASLDHIIKGSMALLEKLPKRKRLRRDGRKKGLPIGNLTSQLFSNIFLNLLDMFIKRILRARRYGRYVDDMRIVSKSIAFLKRCLHSISAFLTVIGLELQHTKTRIVDAYKGVSFCGAFLMPFRSYILSSTFRKIRMKMAALARAFDEGRIGLSPLSHALQSFIGTMSHYRTYNLSKTLQIQFSL